MAKFKVGDRVRIIGGGVETISSVHPKGQGTGFGPTEVDYYRTRESDGFITDDDIAGVANSCRSTNAVVAKALNAGGWEKIYQIKGNPVRFVYRGEPFYDLKATVEGGNRDYVAVGRFVASAPISQAEAEKLAGAKWRQIKRTARNYDVKPGWTNRWSGELKPGTKITVVDSPMRYGGMAGEVVRRDGARYAVRLDDIAGMEVQLNPNQISVKNAVARNEQLPDFMIIDLKWRSHPGYRNLRGTMGYKFGELIRDVSAGGVSKYNETKEWLERTIKARPPHITPSAIEADKRSLEWLDEFRRWASMGGIEKYRRSMYATNNALPPHAILKGSRFVELKPGMTVQGPNGKVHIVKQVFKDAFTYGIPSGTDISVSFKDIGWKVVNNGVGKNADTSTVTEKAVNGSDDAILRLCKQSNIIQRGKTEDLHEVRYGGGYIYPVVSRDGVLIKVYGSLSEANRRALNAARNAKFKVGDRVKYVGSKYGAPYGKVLTVVKEPDNLGRYIIHWDSDHSGFMAVGSDGFAYEDELVLANAVRNAAGYVDASSVALYPGDAVVFKAQYSSHKDDDEWLERNGDTVREVRGNDVKIGPSANDWAKKSDLMVWHNAARNAAARNSNWKTEDFDTAARKVKSKYKGVTWVSYSPSGENRIDIEVRPNEDVDKVAQDAIRIFKGEGIDMKVAGSTPLHYLGGLPPKQKSATWFRLLPMNSSARSRNAVVAKALNAAAARNAKDSRIFKPGEKITWWYLDGEEEDGTVIADKGTYVEAKMRSGKVVYPSKLQIMENTATARNAYCEAGDYIETRDGGQETVERIVGDKVYLKSGEVISMSDVKVVLSAKRVARNGYVVLRTASGGTGRVYEGEEVEYDGKTYKAAALGSPQLDKATLVDGAGNKIVVKLKDPSLKAKA